VLMATGYNALHFGALKRRKRRYEAFRQQRMSLSERSYGSGLELSETDPGYDAYVVGSDQVWNMGIVDFDMAYFLGFAGDARRIALAASFGPASGERALPDDAKLALGQFDLLTVRENRGAEQMEAAGLTRPQTVPDPVFFLSKEQWCHAASSKKRKKKYMLCYFPGVVTAEFDAYTKNLARTRGWERVLLMPHWRNLLRRDKKDYSAGPEEFLALIRDAEMICTNSFHAAAFAVIFGKEFIVGTHSYGADERINTLLRRAGLESCEFRAGEYTYTRPDLAAAVGRLRPGAEESKAMLLRALE